MDQIRYWLKGEDCQNFGDYLTEYFMKYLFLETPRNYADVRIVGSFLSDGFIPDQFGSEHISELIESKAYKTLIAWGGGVREAGALSAAKKQAIDILAVRGPLSASELRLGQKIPIGDPALLLPAIYTPSKREKFVGQTLCIPHFHDTRLDKELLSLTGADLVLRPNIAPSIHAIERFIDALYSAQFILTASLHGAIVAAAYGRPFAYWNSGNIDLPIKWQDFSESINIPTVFVDNVLEGVSHYEKNIALALKLPSLWESLAAAPFIPRPDSLLKIFVSEIGSALNGESDTVIKNKINTFENQFDHFRQISDESLNIVKKFENYASKQRNNKTLIEQLSDERVDLLRQLNKAYRSPWHPVQFFVSYFLLQGIRFIIIPFSKQISERLKRSAEKRSPLRFKKMLSGSPELRSLPHKRFAGTPEVIARRILVADYRVPRPDVSAGETATAGLLKDLCALGYDVTFISTDMLESPGYDDSLRAMGVTVVNQASGYGGLRAFIKSEGHGFGTYYLIRYDVAEQILPLAKKVAPGARIIFHAPDLYFLRETREAKVKNDPVAMAKADATREREVAIMSAADHVVIVSEAEFPFLQAEPPNKPISVFPALYADVASDPIGFFSRQDIFFLGGFKHSPNVDAAMWFAEQVWPLVHEALPEVVFKIVGAEMPPAVIELGRKPGIEIVGYVPKLDPILDRSRLGIAPLLYGAGIKGKVAVTMGAGVPNVCTTIAAEGMGIVDGVHALVANDPREFANAITLLYTDEKLWTRISENGRSLVLERFGNAANRASFISALNDARALPIPLFIEACNKSAPIAFPIYDIELVPDVSIIVPVYDKWELTRACLNSIALTSANSGVRYEVILADDGSTDNTVNAAEIFPGLRIVRTPSNLGFLRNCNNAAAQARGRYLLLLNNDTIVLPGWLKALYEAMEADPDIAIAGSKLLYPDGKVQEAGAVLFQNGTAVNLCRGLERDAPIVNIVREVDYISGASIIIRSDFWKSLGGFDVRYKNAYCEDCDIAMRARSEGLYVSYQPASEVIHFEHQSYLEQAPSHNSELQDHNTAILVDKWGEVLKSDHVPRQEWQVAASKAERRISASALERRRSGKLNILYFSPFPSHPAIHGNQAVIQQFGRRFQGLGHKVHFALLKSNMYDSASEQAMREAWDSFDILPNTHPLVFKEYKIPFDGWYTEGLGEVVRVLCEKYQIDIVLCSYVFQSKLLEYVPSYILKVIDTHDKMGDRYEMLRANGQPPEFFSCTPEEEGAYLRRADVVIALREEEARYFNSVTGRNSAIVVSHVDEPCFIDRKYDRLANIGLVASPNRINLAIVNAFLETLSRQCGGSCPFTIHIAGKVKDMVDALPKSKTRAFRAPWVRMLGYVPNIESFYRQMDAIVSPVTMGTGINVKTVQAMAYGAPLISTRWGGKGIETGDPMHNFEDMDSLVRGLLTLEGNPDELNHLAKVSRTRYTAFYNDAIAAIQGLFQHNKITGVPVSLPSEFSPSSKVV